MQLESVYAEIERDKRRLGTDVVILVHHYQRDEVIQFADHRGDSLELSRVAAQQRQAKYIVFCGVNFMAETAAMLCDPAQTVVQPAGDAPCPMAHMANVDQAEEAWERLTAVWGDDLIPITYQNSTAAVKAFCGRHGGAVCTSSNAERLFRWALGQRGHLIFFPDRWLGTNSALALGIAPDEIAVWDPDQVEDSLANARHARVVVWQGYCHVHVSFTVDHVRAIREAYPEAKVIVHPECTADVVAAADAYGSTAGIIRYAEQAPPGSTIAVGTEINMVARLAREHPALTVLPLARSLCVAMYRTNPVNLRDVLHACAEGDPIHVIRVDAETKRWANLALERMLNQ
ncbi:MAG: quinolinate synthase NadA [Anaerolineae bacterium]|nr:quinolinate synthase NadA [Anaerolineae bacterium]